MLQKTEILYQVIENLNLIRVWSSTRPYEMSRDGACRQLRGMMQLREVRDTGLIEIGVYSTDPNEAADIANTIAVVYQQKRLSDLQSNIDKGLEQLKDEMEKQRKRAEDALGEATAIKERDGIVDLDPDGAGLRGPSSSNNADLRPYLEAKARALEAKRIYEAVRMNYAAEINQRGIDFDPAKIWEKAEPPTKPVRFSIYRLRYAFARYFAT